MAYSSYGNTRGSNAWVIIFTNMFLTCVLVGVLIFFYIKMDDFKTDVNNTKQDYDTKYAQNK